MSLCLVGNHSLDKLQEMAETLFSPVENRNLTLPDYTKEVLFDSETGLGHLYKIIPLKDIRQLQIKFPLLADTRGDWESKPTSYLSSIFGHEG